MAKNENEAMLETLLSYKTMALDHEKHDIMLKDKTVLQFLAYSLDSDDSEVVEASLKTVELLVHNNKNHNTLRSTFGVTEALKATSERDGLEDTLKSLAKELKMKLEDAPAFCTRSRVAKVNTSDRPLQGGRKSPPKVYTFHIFGLNEETKRSVESTLIRIHGVISFNVNIGHQRCEVRTIEDFNPQKIVHHIAKETKLEARLILRNKLRQEVLVDLDKIEHGGGDEIVDDDSLPQYLPEEESPVKEKAVHTFDRIKTSAATWVRSATHFLHNSFYW